jgi:serine/threonine protein kinase
VVRRCTLVDTGLQFAIKSIEKTKVQQNHILMGLLENELSILGAQSHPKIISIVDLLEDYDNYYIVSELVEGGELLARLEKVESFTEAQAANIIWQVMLGLNYLHLQNITHRDMKPENILLVSKDLDNFEVKISDLGFAQRFEQELTLVLGSPFFMAPELVKREAYTSKVDIWSLGVITFQLLSGKTPFEARSLRLIDWNILNKKVSFRGDDWSDISQEAKDFITYCLDRDQVRRPTINQLFRHPWIHSMTQTHIARNSLIKKNLLNYTDLNHF